MLSGDEESPMFELWGTVLRASMISIESLLLDLTQNYNHRDGATGERNILDINDLFSVKLGKW